LPPRESWERHLEGAGEDDWTAQRLRVLIALEAQGAELMLASADVAVAQAMSAVLAEARARFGRLDGVIHAAGLVDPSGIRPLSETDRSLSEAHFRPKVLGALVLDQLLHDERLDFVILISSLSALLGGTGYAAYAAANSVLDAIARGRFRQEAPWLSVNWDGLVTSPALAGGNGGGRTAGSAAGISAEDAARAFEYVLAAVGRVAQIAVSTRDLNARLSRLLTDARAPHPREAPPLHTRTALRSDHTPPIGDMEREIAGLWQRALGVHPIGRHDPFIELGGDSLLATRLLSELRQEFRVEVTLRGFFDAATVAGVAAYIARLQQEWQLAHEAELLQLIEQLTDAEIDAELKKRGHDRGANSH
jgi:acyl carrier protein